MRSDIWVISPNGVGKSTIFNLITGLINPKMEKLKLSMKMLLNSQFT